MTVFSDNYRNLNRSILKHDDTLPMCTVLHSTWSKWYRIQSSNWVDVCMLAFSGDENRENPPTLLFFPTGQFLSLKIEKDCLLLPVFRKGFRIFRKHELACWALSNLHCEPRAKIRVYQIIRKNKDAICGYCATVEHKSYVWNRRIMSDLQDNFLFATIPI